MQNTIDRLVNALYLAKSDRRDKMLIHLAESVMYSFSDHLNLVDIQQLIKEEYDLTLISYELKESLESLVEAGFVIQKNESYCLTDASKKRLDHEIGIHKKYQEERFHYFSTQYYEITGFKLEESQVKLLWETYNEYLLERFFEFGHRAIDIFLPNRTENKYRSNGFAGKAIGKLKDEKLKKAFKEIVLHYPDNLSLAEIKHLENLANKAEKFYSLGLRKEEYEKLGTLNLTNVVLLADTNFLYSVLDLRDHPQSEAVKQIVLIAKEKRVDIRISYLPSTFQELKTAKEDLEKTVSKENYRPSHIKQLLATSDLDAFSRKYFEAKLKDSLTPHPSQKITHAKDVLASKGINIFNHKLPHLEDENPAFLNAKVTEYRDYERKISDWRMSNGRDSKNPKNDKKVIHDVFLREAIIDRRQKSKTEEQIKYLGLTLDNSLVEFDEYELRSPKHRPSDVINPIFMTPITFLKRIRPFLPVETDDYSRAFIKAVTMTTFDSEDLSKSELLQRSFTYFLRLGIEDEQTIGTIIQKELFLKEFKENEEKGTAESFIRDQVNDVVDTLRYNAERIKKEFDEELLSVKIRAEENEKGLNAKVLDKASEVSELKEAVKTLENLINRDREVFQKNEQKRQYELQLKSYQEESWEKDQKKYRKGLCLFAKFCLFHFIPVSLSALLTFFPNPIKEFVKNNNWPEWSIFAVGAILTITVNAILNIYRTIFFDKPEKELVRNSWEYYTAKLSGEKMKKFKQRKLSEYKSDFELQNPNNVLIS